MKFENLPGLGACGIVRPMRTAFSALAVAVLLWGCASGSPKPQPLALGPVNALIGVEAAWTAQIGPSDAKLMPHVVGQTLYVASAQGTVAALDAATGRDVWRTSLSARIAAGVGSDGETAAVITQGNELVAVVAGQERWRVRLPARSFTAPLVAGQRVFVLTADRSVLAFDARSGARLWQQSRQGEALVLEQTGVLLAVGDTLVVGLSARLTGLDPLNGSVRWDALLANARGTNEVERLVDLVGPASRVGDSVCARAFGAAVGCVDTAQGRVVWTQVAQGATGLQGDERLLVGAEADGRVVAWQRADGQRQWVSERLQHRGPGAPLVAGRTVALGDQQGLLHLFSREDGSEMNRLSTDGSPILGRPVLAGQTLIVQTRNGGVFAWRPQ